MCMERVRWYAGVVAILLSLCSTPTAAQTGETGFLNRVVTVDGADFRHQVYVPASFQRSTSWIFHGDADRVVPVDESRKMAAALKTRAADVQYTEFPGVDHNAWDPAYAREDLWVWLLRQRRR